ncbi:Opsin, ultraviolet-sensitive [Frankliniella fusca]|uniref:Opsin, ultraviolet-sensitive n=1 Tax=Frankliniella fusca TaxID=407009 RepID=A0AAE1I0V1_9NEOP|nr:Opsin, ultraviolet-sensitive [Frankliniella fusca]
MEYPDSADCSNDTAWLPVAEARVSGVSGPTETRLLGWNVPPEDLPHIPTHWLVYPEPDPLINYGLGILYIFFFFFAVVGNGIVIYIFLMAKNLRTPSNIFVVNLAMCDFVMMLKTPIFIYNSFKLGFASGPLGCQIFSIMGSFSGIGAGATNAVIAYDRYMTIAKPFGSKMTRGKAIMIIVLVWMWVTPWVVFPTLEIWGRYVPEGFLTSCTFDYMTDTDHIRAFTGTMFFVCYCVPMTAIIYFYSQIVSHVVAHEKALKAQAKKMNVESLRSNEDKGKDSTEIRIAKMAISLSFLFVLSWTPYATVALIGAFGNKALLTPGVTMIPACCCKLVACFDPYVFALSHPRFRLELQKRMPWLDIKESQPAAKDTASTTTEATSANPD